MDIYYIEFDVFGIDSPNHFDQLLKAELLLLFMLIVEIHNPCQDPA